MTPEVANRRISYERLWALLGAKKMTRAQLRRAASVSPNTMTKLIRNQEVSMSIILKIANYLDCDINDIVELVK